jgi:hypothetical protein
MFAIYLKENLTLITFLSELGDPAQAEYEKPIYDKLEVTFEKMREFYEKQNQGLEIIVLNSDLQEMFYTAEVVKYLKDGEDFKIDTYATIDNYDFRLEGETYQKLPADDAGYLAYIMEEELKKAKEDKKFEVKRLVSEAKVKVVKGNDETFLLPRQSVVQIFENGATIAPFPYIMFDNGNKDLVLTANNCILIASEIKESIQYLTTTKLKAEITIDALTTKEEVENFAILDFNGNAIEMEKLITV